MKVYLIILLLFFIRCSNKPEDVMDDKIPVSKETLKSIWYNGYQKGRINALHSGGDRELSKRTYVIDSLDIEQLLKPYFQK